MVLGDTVGIGGMESSSNYCKLPDGTMIAWGATGAINMANPGYYDRSITFPVPFTSTPHLTVGGMSDSTGSDVGYVFMGYASVTNTGAVIRGFKAYGTGRSPVATWIAIGRWK